MNRLEIRLDAGLYKQLCQSKPKSLSLPAFCAFLVEERLATLDRLDTLGAPSEAGATSNTSTSNTSKNIYKAINEPINDQLSEPISVPEARPAKARRAKAQGSPEFEQFWKQYQAIKKRASNQSKPRALEVWSQVIANVSPEALRDALSRAVNQQVRQEREGGFASPFPDCFRWLRDGYYEAFLEGPAVACAVVVDQRPIFDPNNPESDF